MKKMIRRSGEKRFLSLLLCVLMMTALLPALNTRAEAINSKTIEQVRAWLDSEINAKQQRGDGECVAFCNYYLNNFWGTPTVWGNARDWYCPSEWTQVSTGNSIYNLQVGDLIVERYSPYGHVAVFYGIENGQAKVVDQNVILNGVNIRYPNKHTWWSPFSTTTDVYRPRFASARTPQNLGDDFYAYIILANPGKHIENSSGNVQIAANGNDSNDPRQIWHFTRQSNGSYMIVNEYDGKCLDAA